MDSGNKIFKSVCVCIFYFNRIIKVCTVNKQIEELKKKKKKDKDKLLYQYFLNF